MKVLIADDHAIVREGLKKTLAENTDIEVADEAANGIQAISIVRSQPLEVVVLDISMPSRNGLEILKIIKDERPKLPVLMLTEMALEARSLGQPAFFGNTERDGLWRELYDEYSRQSRHEKLS